METGPCLRNSVPSHKRLRYKWILDARSSEFQTLRDSADATHEVPTSHD